MHPREISFNGRTFTLNVYQENLPFIEFSSDKNSTNPSEYFKQFLFPDLQFIVRFLKY